MSSKRFYKIVTYPFVLFAILFYVFGAVLVALLIQVPPLRQDTLTLVGTFLSGVGFILCIGALKNILKTKFSKEAC